MDPVLEAICRALCEEWCVDPDGTEGLLLESTPIVPDEGEPNWRAYEPLARAVLSAIEGMGLKIVGPEPTEEMVKAGVGKFDYESSRDGVIHDWRAMFDAAPPRPVEG